MDTRYITYINTIEKIPQNLLNENKEKVEKLFYDVNERIRAYDSQHTRLVKELGVLHSPKNNNSTDYFFQTIIDYLQLALGIYPKDSEEYKVFEQVTTIMNNFLEGKISTFEQAQPLEKALLVQITKSAWALTNPDRSMGQVAQQIGGKLKNKTRKARRV